MTVQSPPLILSVSEITQAIKLTLEATFPRVWVKGEVSNPKMQSSGHFYFSLKDDFAQISCVCFRGDLTKVVMVPKAGDQVLVRAEMSLYAPRGGYQLIVKELSHVGVGDQLIKLELLKQKLQKLGYFAPERKRPLPHFPKRIGVVTSPTGAVIQDILKVLGRRMSGFHLILNPVRVQGDGADIEIAQAIRQFNDYNLADILIVGRGGGSAEDLAPFNSEVVASAIFQSQIPIVSAVGHETDITVADLVADVRAATPSQAAEIISHEERDLLEKLAKYTKNIGQQAAKIVTFNQQRLDDIQEHLDMAVSRSVATTLQDLLRFKKSLDVVRPSNRIRERLQQLGQFEKNIALSLQRIFRAKKQELLSKNERLNVTFRAQYVIKKRAFTRVNFATLIPQLVQKGLFEKKRKLENVSQQLASLDPKKILAKGYSIIFSQKDGSIVSSAKDIQKDDAVKITFHDGEAAAQILQVRENK